MTKSYPAGNSMDPRPAPRGNGPPGKSRGHMDIPPPGVERNPGPHLDQALDQPVDGLSHFLSPEVELAHHMHFLSGGKIFPREHFFI